MRHDEGPATAGPFLLRGRGRAAASFLCLAALWACRGCAPPPEGNQASLVSYNVMALFDARDSGLEYPGYSVAADGWGEAAYAQRLSNVKAALEASVRGGPDIACLVEIENEAVLSDLRERMKGSGYVSMGFAGGDTATGCGILSRFPILALRSHRPQAAPDGPRQRPILEAELDARGVPLILFVNHWKSKSGGEAETEGARIEAASLLADLMAERMASRPEAACLACGDFNEEADEWEKRGSAYPTALGRIVGEGGPGDNSPPFGAPILLSGGGEIACGDRPGGTPARKAALLVSPWLLPGQGAGASYVWRGSGQRIDNFLLCPGLFDGKGWEYSGFSVVDAHPLTDAQGRPQPWDSGRGSGFSDHLPLLLELSRRP